MTDSTPPEVREKRYTVINSDVYCIKCETFLGMTCDPFRSNCESCFPARSPSEEPIKCKVLCFVEGAGEFYCDRFLPCSKHSTPSEGKKV